MRRNKKITISYLEKDSKKEGIQGFCRIIYNRKSTMFKIGVPKLIDTSKWLRDREEKIEKIIRAEIEVNGSKYEIKGIRERLMFYSEPLSNELIEYNIGFGLHWKMKSKLTVVDCNEVFRDSKNDSGIDRVYALLSNDYGEATNDFIVDYLSEDIFIITMQFRLFTLEQVGVKGVKQFLNYHLIIEPDMVIERFIDFLRGMPDNLSFLNHIYDGYYKDKVKFIAEKLPLYQFKSTTIERVLKYERERIVEWSKYNEGIHDSFSEEVDIIPY